MQILCKQFKVALVVQCTGIRSNTFECLQSMRDRVDVSLSKIYSVNGVLGWAMASNFPCKSKLPNRNFRSVWIMDYFIM